MARVEAPGGQSHRHQNHQAEARPENKGHLHHHPPPRPPGQRSDGPLGAHHHQSPQPSGGHRVSTSLPHQPAGNREAPAGGGGAAGPAQQQGAGGGQRVPQQRLRHLGLAPVQPICVPDLLLPGAQGEFRGHEGPHAPRHDTAEQHLPLGLCPQNRAHQIRGAHTEEREEEEEAEGLPRASHLEIQGGQRGEEEGEEETGEGEGGAG